MKKYIYLFLTSLIVQFGYTQIIVGQAEYFWDSDPGIGNGIPILATDGNFDAAFERITQSDFTLPSVGLHTLNIRVKDNSGVWGSTFSTVIKIEQNITTIPITIAQAEYFWDADPGQGNGTIVLAFDSNFNSAFEKLTQSGFTLPTIGFHTFNIRVKDSNGIWGTTFSNLIKIEPAILPFSFNLTQAEYFWDNDPGLGNATTILATDGNFSDAFERLSQTGFSFPGVGFHTFNIRVKDGNGIWGPIFSNVIKLESTATPLPLTIAQAEYFWDSDPGEGNGTIILALDGNFNSAFEKISQTGFSMPGLGFHTFNVRVKDSNDSWGKAFSNVIKIESTSTPVSIQISQAEYFWDNDPGEGNGDTLLAVDESYNTAFEKFFQNGIQIAQPIGLHVFNVRIKDNSGVWSPVFKNAIFIETNLCSAPVPTAPFTQLFCVSGTVSDLVATGTNLKWFSSSTNGNALALNTPLVTGSYYVTQTIGVCESARVQVLVTISPNVAPTFNQVSPICAGDTLSELPTVSVNGITGVWSPIINNTATTTYTFTPNAGQCALITTMTITVNANDIPIITSNGPTTFCLGESITLTSSIGASYLWSNGATTQSIIVNSSGNYSVQVTNPNGCSRLSALTSITVNNNTSNIVDITACNSYTWSANNQTYISSGTYTSTVDCHTEILNLTLSCTSVIYLKLNIEGFYDTTLHAMRPVRANQGNGVSITDVDFITVELRDTTTPTTIIDSTTTILEANGTAMCNFMSTPNGSYYLAVKHRNSLQTWSATSVTVGPTVATYDFSDASSKAYGNNMFEVETGVWAFFTGDINQDGNIDNSDYSFWETDANEFGFGNYVTDLNGDGNVDNTDYSIWEKNANNFVYVVTP